ncbi:MAG: fatty acid desaturase [Aliishimia sp.]
MCQPEKAPKGIRWDDLTALNKWDIFRELTLPLPWLALSLALYTSAMWPLGAIASFMFFLCALRLNHEAIHGNLDLPRRWDYRVMHGLSAIMLGSNTADAFCHLKHHKHSGGPEDYEGKCSHMRWYAVLAYGPKFPIDLNRAALQHGGPNWRKRVQIDWLCITLFVGLCAALNHPALWLHIAAMSLAQCLTAFFAVWITHQGTHGSGLAGRSQRGVLARIAYLMFYHREHHLYPRVPVSRLPKLAGRLDRQAPGYAASRVPVIPWLEIA